MIAAVVVLVVVGVAAVVMTLKTDVGDATVTRDAVRRVGRDVRRPVAAETGVEAPTLENQAWSVGQPVRDGNFEFVVTGSTGRPSSPTRSSPTCRRRLRASTSSSR